MSACGCSVGVRVPKNKQRHFHMMWRVVLLLNHQLFVRNASSLKSVTVGLGAHSHTPPHTPPLITQPITYFSSSVDGEVEI